MNSSSASWTRCARTPPSPPQSSSRRALRPSRPERQQRRRATSTSRRWPPSSTRSPWPTPHGAAPPSWLSGPAPCAESWKGSRPAQMAGGGWAPSWRPPAGVACWKGCTPLKRHGPPSRPWLAVSWSRPSYGATRT